MPTEDEVLKIRQKLDKMISSQTTDQSSSIDILKALQELPMTLDVLTKTRIGMTVNNFRKACTNEEVISLSKNLIKVWKKLLPDSKTEKKDKPNNNGDSASSEDKVKEEVERRKSTTASDTSDPVRLKCRELLFNSLKQEEGQKSFMDPFELAASIEDNIYEEFNNTDTKYKNRVRSRVANLKDSKNPDLKLNVLSGMITADRIAKMTADEMASGNMKELRAKYTKQAIDDHQMAKTGGTVSDLFRCGKCGKNNCTYNQVQTRSADEPMTTFVLCNECGKRWKFC